MNRELAVLGRLIHAGTLDIETADGVRERFGEGMPFARWRLAGLRTLRRILADPEVELGESYTRGDWQAEPGRLAELLTLLMRNASELAGRDGHLARLPALLWQQWNRVRASYRNVAHHYDLDEGLFRRFLDAEMY